MHAKETKDRVKRRIDFSFHAHIYEHRHRTEFNVCTENYKNQRRKKKHVHKELVLPQPIAFESIAGPVSLSIHHALHYYETIERARIAAAASCSSRSISHSFSFSLDRSIRSHIVCKIIQIRSFKNYARAEINRPRTHTIPLSLISAPFYNALSFFFLHLTRPIALKKEMTHTEKKIHSRRNYVNQRRNSFACKWKHDNRKQKHQCKTVTVLPCIRWKRIEWTTKYEKKCEMKMAWRKKGDTKKSGRYISLR